MTLHQKIKAVAKQLQSTTYDLPVRQLAQKLEAELEQEMDPVLLLNQILLSGDDWAALRILDLLAELKDERMLPTLLHTLAYETHQQPFDMQLEALRQQNEIRGAVGFAEHTGRDIADMRLQSIMALGRLGNPGAIPGLTRVLNDEREWSDMKNAASLALEQIGTAAALAAVQKWKSKSE